MATERSLGQLGETLIESILAILVLSLIAVAAFAGLQTSILASTRHKESAIAETLLRSAAERLQDPDVAYIPRAGCPGAATYGQLPERPGYGAVEVDVRFWAPPGSIGDGTAPVEIGFSEPGTPQHCPAVDSGLQAIRLSVTAPSGHVEQLELVKRAN